MAFENTISIIAIIILIVAFILACFCFQSLRKRRSSTENHQTERTSRNNVAGQDNFTELQVDDLDKFTIDVEDNPPLYDEVVTANDVNA